MRLCGLRSTPDDRLGALRANGNGVVIFLPLEPKVRAPRANVVPTPLASVAMSDVRHRLSPRDRVELLCWLTCGSLGAYYLNESWPNAAFHVEAAHKWLDRHGREAD